jgi:hypothetical protein
VFSWSGLPNIWSLCFCLHKRKRNEQSTTSNPESMRKILKTHF